MRLLSYNVKSLQIDADAVRRVIVETSPDVVAVQEATRYLTGGRRRMRRLAAETGMVCVIPGGSPFGAYTTALLVSAELAPTVVGTRGRPLSWRWWRRRDLVAWPTRRGCAVVDLGDVVVISVHLGLDARERADHCDEINALLERYGPHRCIVAGDLNETPDGPSWAALGRHLRDMAAGSTEGTFPVPTARRRIDGVLVGSAIAGGEVRVVRSDAALRGSDHFPLLCADLQVGPVPRG
ncbi:Metal-dependent hydrolase, endonuclease/exonuclease/phosphatase family [Sanguibacter gelidistatuariae]|uniref:Metal-dependent hydrolase, endonuclease/exonuclease/phosphatase family n=1 Tax=Sanguibacter gelidistatuariae TaxID=1814289 RepID=A0A1G6HMQ7_9MICO|nr:endonuclease/exonuclease/phosphatase family protein [Sanguibacter gelidistatuariae]SDB95587.1 Metal-dependent hydrolase, endonuclease/exonuclease/phosphatase family [Sanguibacter gelidistatuariae]